MLVGTNGAGQPAEQSQTRADRVPRPRQAALRDSPEIRGKAEAQSMSSPNIGGEYSPQERHLPIPMRKK